MNYRIALLWFFMSVFSAANAANEVKPPIVLLPREAKLSPGMMTYVSSTLPGPYVGGWMDKSRSIDYELKVEPLSSGGQRRASGWWLSLCQGR